MINLPPDLVDHLRCPACESRVSVTPNEVNCSNPSCGRHYPIAEGVPILIDDNKSLFSIEDVIGKTGAFLGSRHGWKETIWRALPTLTKNINAPTNYSHFASLLGSGIAPSRVLVIGGGRQGEGMSALPDDRITLVETDISLGPKTQLICDGHDIPFIDHTFDGCVIQAVLQHTVDPYRCVSEIHRVLKPGGVVYAETAFMQQVHGGRYDFTRFTHRGQRRLFRYFEEVDSGATCGPAMALAWSYQYFLICWASSSAARGFLFAFARVSSFWLKYLDRFLINRPNALYAASAFYFLGRKAIEPISDKDLVCVYRSAGSN